MVEKTPGRDQGWTAVCPPLPPIHSSPCWCPGKNSADWSLASSWCRQWKPCCEAAGRRQRPISILPLHCSLPSMQWVPVPLSLVWPRLQFPQCQGTSPSFRSFKPGVIMAPLPCEFPGAASFLVCSFTPTPLLKTVSQWILPRGGWDRIGSTQGFLPRELRQDICAETR